MLNSVKIILTFTLSDGQLFSGYQMYSSYNGYNSLTEIEEELPVVADKYFKGTRLLFFCSVLSLDKNYHNDYLALSRLSNFGQPCSLKEVLKAKFLLPSFFDFCQFNQYLHGDDICECSVHWRKD